MLFHGKTVLITGGTSGIGLATARHLSRIGAHTILVGRDGAKGKLANVANATVVQANISKSADLAQLIEQLEREFGTLTHLVNAAGIFTPKPFIDHTVADYDQYHDINRGTFFVTQAAAKIIAANGGGAIVNVGSMWAHQAVKATPSAAYSMAKVGLHALTQHLAMELAEKKIRVNAVAPAVVATPVYESFIPKDQVAGALQGFNAFHPIGRIGTAEEIADSIVFLLSEQSSWITGTVLNVDGGVMAGRS